MVKVQRSYPAPVSLEEEKNKAQGSYRKQDVVNALKRDFNNKCYICEMGELQDPQIEHRLPHHNGEDKEKKFAWDNLFWACGHCNLLKNKRIYDEGIIDCCKIDPEEYLEITVDAEDVVVRARYKENDILVKNTVMLLNEVFSKDHTGMRSVATHIRLKYLKREMNALYKALAKYKEEEDKEYQFLILTGLLDKSSAFAAYKRDYIRTHKKWYPELVKLLT